MRRIDRLLRRIKSVWLHPIDVFVFHKVGEDYEPLYGGIEDWTQLEKFKSNLLLLKKKYEFITLSEALAHLKNDKLRFRNLAVLTCDDGYQSILEILPWLELQQIPISIFISVKYLDGKSYDTWFDNHWDGLDGEKKKELVNGMYLHWSHLDEKLLCSHNVSLSIHGYGHDEVLRMDKNEFEVYVEKCINVLKPHPRYEPYYAYTWGHHSAASDKVLVDMGLVPVLCDNVRNREFDGAVHRICIDGKQLHDNK